jgi:phosphomannomutase
VLKSEGRSLADTLDDLAREYGLHATDQLSARFGDLSQIDAAMARLRKEPPRSLGGRDVTLVEDFTDGVRGLPPTDGLCYHLDGGCRVVVRPSGTEPKVKCYLEVVIPVTDGDVAAARRKAADSIAATKVDIAAAAGLPGPALPS